MPKGVDFSLTPLPPLAENVLLAAVLTYVPAAVSEAGKAVIAPACTCAQGKYQSIASRASCNCVIIVAVYTCCHGLPVAMGSETVPFIRVLLLLAHSLHKLYGHVLMYTPAFV